MNADVQAAPVSTTEVRRRLDAVRERIRATAPVPDAVSVVAVTKGFGPDVVAAAAAAGCHELGENYAQELLAKATSAPTGTRWHFLGPLQRRRTAALAPHVGVWEAIDRRAAAESVAAHAPGAAVFVQVNVTAAAGRPGCAPGEAASLVTACNHLDLHVAGLMTVAPTGDPPGAERCFATLASMAADLGVEQRSMGMSDDFEIALAHGATSIRLGRALFGPRPGFGSRPGTGPAHR